MKVVFVLMVIGAFGAAWLAWALVALEGARERQAATLAGCESCAGKGTEECVGCPWSATDL